MKVFYFRSQAKSPHRSLFALLIPTPPTQWRDASVSFFTLGKFN